MPDANRVRWVGVEVLVTDISRQPLCVVDYSQAAVKPHREDHHLKQITQHTSRSTRLEMANEQYTGSKKEPRNEYAAPLSKGSTGYGQQVWTWCTVM